MSWWPSSSWIDLTSAPAIITLSEAFAKGDSIKELADKGVLHPVMPGLINYPNMYRHQQLVFEAVKANKHVLVSTGTGSGKTEAFLYPIIDDLLRQRDQGIVEGLTATLIYPMNALANDQLERLRVILAGTGITFGQWIGSTPKTGQSPLVDRFDGADRSVPETGSNNTMPHGKSVHPSVTRRITPELS